MSIRFGFPDAPLPAPTSRGTAAVGLLHELPALELTAILCLRAWCDGGDRRAQLDLDLNAVLDPSDASTASGGLVALMRTVVAAARRPLMRHAFGCRCFGGDEGAFANLIAAAGVRDREEAMLFASLLMNGHVAWDAVRLAEELGQAFLRMARYSLDDPVSRSCQGSDVFLH